MSLSKITIRNYLFFILLMLAAFFPRLIWLDKVPTAVNADELHYMLDTKSIVLTGKDMLGETSFLNILVFQHPKNEPMQSELPYFLEIPFIGIFNFSLFNMALPNVLLGVIAVLFIFLITSKLFNKNVGFIAGFIAAINPWLIFSTRTVYEMGPAICLFLCVLYILLITKGWKILLSLPFALLLFYSYIGTKLIFIPIILIIAGYAFLYVNKKQYFKQYAVLILFSFVLTFFFLFQISKFDESRISEIISPNNPAIIKQVNEARKNTISNPFSNIYENKLIVYGSILVKNTLNIFSPVYLFVNADNFFLTSGHGLFYYLDLLFIVVGAIWTFIYKKRIFLFLSSLILISILPQILHDPFAGGNFTPHIALLFPFLIMFIALGINVLINKLKHAKYSYLFFVFVVVIYIFSFAGFLNYYFFRFPLSEGIFSIENRILSKYITFSKKENKPIIVYSVNPKLTYREFLFYSNYYNTNTLKEINNSFKHNILVFNNISFVSCSRNQLISTGKEIIIDDAQCDRVRDLPSLSISQLGDSGRRYNIYNDKMCSKYKLSNYIGNLKISDFSIENLSEENFCKSFIISYQ